MPVLISLREVIVISEVVTVLAVRLSIRPYLAGIWRRRWIDGLLWQSSLHVSSTVKDHHASGYGSPSWSWASSLERPDNGIVTADTSAIVCPDTDLVEFDDYENSQDRPLAKLSGSNVQLSGDNEFGSVKSASIDLTGLIIPLGGDIWQNEPLHTGQSDSKKTPIEFSIYSSGFHITKSVVFVTARYERDQEDENEKHFASAKIHRRQSHRAHVNFTAPYDPERPCFLLPLLDSREVIDNDSLDYLEGLVLQEKVYPAPAGGAEPSERQYVRIGTFYDYPRNGSLGKLIVNTMLASHATPDQDAIFYMKVTAYLKQKYGEDVDDDWDSYTTTVWNRCDEPLALGGERLVAGWKKVRIV